MGLMDQWIALRSLRENLPEGRICGPKTVVSCTERPLIAANQSTDEITNHVRIMFLGPIFRFTTGILVEGMTQAVHPWSLRIQPSSPKMTLSL